MSSLIEILRINNRKMSFANGKTDSGITFQPVGKLSDPASAAGSDASNSNTRTFEED